MTAPALHTERLILRRPEPGDVEPFIAYLGSPRMEWLGGAMGRDDAWRMVAAVMGHWQIRGYGLFTICLRTDGTPVGAVGPQFPEGWPEPELAWHIWTDAHEGRGLAHEAALAARAHAFSTLGWATAVSYIHDRNTRSCTLAERLGARPDPAAAPLRDGFTTWRHKAPAEAAA